MEKTNIIKRLALGEAKGKENSSLSFSSEAEPDATHHVHQTLISLPSSRSRLPHRLSLMVCILFVVLVLHCLIFDVNLLYSWNSLLGNSYGFYLRTPQDSLLPNYFTDKPISTTCRTEPQSHEGGGAGEPHQQLGKSCAASGQDFMYSHFGLQFDAVNFCRGNWWKELNATSGEMERKPLDSLGPPGVNQTCLPTFELAITHFDWRLSDVWSSTRWRYHMNEVARKIVTLFFPIDESLHRSYRHEMAALLAFLTPYIEIDPPVQIRSDCTVPSSYTVTPVSSTEVGQKAHTGKPAGNLLENESSAEAGEHITIVEYCEEAKRAHFGAFTGAGRTKPVKIVDMFIFGFELDVLELRLYELNHTVDYFVIMEAPHHTIGLYRKPLFFKQNMARFSQFLHKIIYLEMPYELSAFFANYCKDRFVHRWDNCWRFEFKSRDVLLWQFVELNEGRNLWGNLHVKPPIVGVNDIILIGDVDEIPKGSRLRHLKFCTPVAQPTLAWALVHYSGRVDAVARKASGIQPVPDTIGPLLDTASYRWFRKFIGRDAFRTGWAVNRHRSSQLNPPLYLYGGWHMSDYTYLPFLMMKLPVDDLKPGYEPWSAFRWASKGDLLKAQTSVWEEHRDYRQVGWQVVEQEEVNDLYKEVGVGDMPWILKCNPRRYPSWFKGFDPRYLMQPSKSFYIGGQPVVVRDEDEWLRTLDEVRRSYRDSDRWIITDEPEL